MNLDSNYAKLITAAHRGNKLAQQSLSVIDDTRRAILKSCVENHILPPQEFHMIEIGEAVAIGMVQASAWLRAVITEYGQDIRRKPDKPSGSNNLH